jgi:dihydrofolate reductase
MKASVFIASSIDGFIARENGGIDWLDAPETIEGEDYGYDAFIESVDAIVMGRHSFETVLGFGGDWPYPKPVVVLSSREVEIPAHLADRVSSMSGSPRSIVERLGATGVESIYVDGGITIQRFLAEGLIDRIIITRIPILLGAGIGLFGALDGDIELEHVATRAYPNGLVQSEYVRLNPKR